MVGKWNMLILSTIVYFYRGIFAVIRSLYQRVKNNRCGEAKSHARIAPFVYVLLFLFLMLIYNVVFLYFR